MHTTTISQTVSLPATPIQVYQALLSSKNHSAFTGDEARMSARVGGTFSAFSGYITGKNLALHPGKTIIQEWRAEEEHWPADHFSVATFELKAARSGTTLMFSQTGVPIEHAKSIANGWKAYYWEPLKKFFSASATTKRSSGRSRSKV